MSQRFAGKRPTKKYGISLSLILRCMIVLLVVLMFVQYSLFNRHHERQQQQQQEQEEEQQPPQNLNNNNNKNNQQQQEQPQQQQRQWLQWPKNKQADNNNNNKNKKKKKQGTISGGEIVNGQLVKYDKYGNTVMDVITSDKDLVANLGDDDDNFPAAKNLTLEEAIKGRERLVDILHTAGITDLDIRTIKKLPTAEQVTKLYGDGPVIYGLETCETFRKTIPQKKAFVAVSGMFNTGTNPLFNYLNANCILPENRKDPYGGMKWQVPWGKHMLANRKWTNTIHNDRFVNKTGVLPVVIVRDPYSWMQSLCRKSYAAKFPHTKKHCPSLVPTHDDLRAFAGQFRKQKDTVPVNMKLPAPPNDKDSHWMYNWDSLVHLWNDWYHQYYHDADYPRIIVRFEDLYFHVEEMITQICKCGGGVLKEENKGRFVYLVGSGKWGAGHTKDQTNLISGMIKYGKEKNRYDGFTNDDLTFAYEKLDPELMTSFQYEIPPPP